MSVPVTELAMRLIRRRSLTPDDAGCQDLIAGRLASRGFEARRVRFGEVDNLWLRRGAEAPLLAFAGHTDVVPPGPLDQWRCDPFGPEIHDGLLYGRGAADMKGGLAAWTIACERFIDAYPAHRGSIALLITSDEEGPGHDGTRRVMPWLREHGEHIDWCVVGEAASEKTLGDTIKNGRRGSLSGILTVHGRQSHIAYAQAGDNPIHALAPALGELCATAWDNGNDYFQPTSFQISNIHAGTGAENVIPGRIDVHFNLRYSTATSAAAIRERVTAVLDSHALDYSIDWQHRGEPYLTPAGELTEAISASIETVIGRRPHLSTAGGTSDGRFISPAGAQVVEVGPINATIHRTDEHVAVADLEKLVDIYYEILRRLLIENCG